MKNRKTLKTRLIFFISLLFVIFGLAFSVYFYHQTRQILQQELVKRGKTLVYDLARNSKVGFQARNKIVLKQLLEGVMDNPDVVYGMIVTEKGEVLAEEYKDERYKEEIPYVSPPSAGVKITSFKIGKEKFYDFVAPIIIPVETAINDEFLFGGQTTAPTENYSVTTPKESVQGFVRLGMSTFGISMEIKETERVGLIILIITLLLAITILYLYIEYAISPLAELTAVAKRVSTGDLTQRAEVKREDEIGLLAGVFNQMLTDIKNVIKKIQIITKKLTSLSDEVQDTAEEVYSGATAQFKAVEETGSSIEELNASMREITEKIDVLSSSSEESSSSITELTATIAEVDRNMESLSSAIEETSSSISQMTAAIKEVASHIEELFKASENTAASMNQIDKSISEIERNTNETLQLSEKVTENATRGKEAVDYTRDSIREIKQTFSEVAKAIERLNAKTEEIGSILLVIDDIAEQTNLLALNAAIIAAQAGEEGKSFAVIADEIKELVERTSLSTKEVGDLINSLREESTYAKEALEKSDEKVNKSVTLSEEAGKALEEILNSAMLSTERMKEISRSTTDQANGSHQVTESINRIVEMARKISIATKDQEAGSERILHAIEDMRQIARKVKISTKEQTQGSRQIMEAVKNINQMVHFISRSVQEQQKGVEHILDAMNRIQEITRQNQLNASSLESVVKNLNEQIEGLYEIVKYFRIEEEE